MNLEQHFTKLLFDNTGMRRIRSEILSKYSVDDIGNDLPILEQLLNEECNIVPFEDFSNTKYSKIIKEFQRKVVYAGGYEFCDNFRVSNGSVLDEIIYDIQYTNGCCGVYSGDFIYEGITYKVGFNYGH